MSQLDSVEPVEPSEPSKSGDRSDLHAVDIPLGRNESGGDKSGGDRSLRMVANRLSHSLGRDVLVQQTTLHLREFLQVDRVALYYFYNHWKGQVTFESIRDQKFSILGSTGPDQCFNDEYAALYEAGRIKAIADISTEPITPCHREFLQTLGVQANLVAPILTERGLWGLLVAHHCQSARPWTDPDIAQIQASAVTLAGASALSGA